MTSDTREDRLLTILESQNKLLEQFVEASKESNHLTTKLASELKRVRDIVENIRGTTMAPIREDVAKVMQSRQYGFLETIALLRDERKSFARFGDGEFRLMFRPEHSLKFQKNSPALAAGLREVLEDPHPSTLVGLPHMYLDVHWSIVLSETWHYLKPIIEKGDGFGNSHVSRPAVFQMFGQDAVALWRSVWAGRDAVVVSGKGSRFNLLPDLFGSLNSTTELFAEPTNAFEDVERTVENVVSTGRDLALLSLGPSATVAADMLAKRGVQALDIGHLSSSYENVFDGAQRPESTPIAR